MNNKLIIATVMFWTGLFMLNSWILSYLGKGIEAYVGMTSISLVSIIFFYKKEIENKLLKKKQEDKK